MSTSLSPGENRLCSDSALDLNRILLMRVDPL